MIVFKPYRPNGPLAVKGYTEVEVKYVHKIGYKAC